ncbi:MAG: hypothetical protein Ta2G_06230 [Termitinemataceae bacterium]|nr:MAG: hypothetical protein Ta2G_06230 [Termitinemataceae bacterium]
MEKYNLKKKKTNKRPLLTIILCVVLALGVLLVCTKGKPLSVFSVGAGSDTTYTVRSEIVRNIIEVAGNIAAAQTQSLQAAGTGTVLSVYFSEGDSVKKGDVILELDDVEQRYNLSRHDYDMEQKRLQGAPRELELMRQQRRVLLQRIKDRQVVANFDGVLAAFQTKPGDVFEAKDSVGQLVDRSYLTTTVEVVETDAPKLAVGQKVIFNFPANGNVPLEGYVHGFPAVGTKTTRGAAVVNAEIRIDNPPDIILPNYSFTGEIEISPPRTYLLVERQAIEYAKVDDKADNNAGNTEQAGDAALATQGGRGERSGASGRGNGERNSAGERGNGTGERGARRSIKGFVEKLGKDGSKERLEVEVRPYGRDFVQIISGLSEGDVLIALVRDSPSGRNAGAAAAGASGARTGQQQGSLFVAPMQGGGRR